MSKKYKMNRKDRKELEVILKKRKQSVVDSLTDETMELWKSAQLNQQWLMGEKIKTSEGHEVDFSMFDFVVATCNFTPDDMTSDLKMLQRFWITAYPYVENVIDHLAHYERQFKELYKIEGTTLKNFALQNLELQCHRLFLEKLDPKVKEEFETFHKEFKDKSDAEIEKVKEKEEEFQKKLEEREEKKKEEEKQRLFAAKLQL